MARRKASEIPILSSSAAETQPRPVADSSRMILLSSSRFLAESFLESLRLANHSRSSSGRTTAPTTSGPARGPRPTSSMPRMAMF